MNKQLYWLHDRSAATPEADALEDLSEGNIMVIQYHEGGFADRTLIPVLDEDADITPLVDLPIKDTFGERGCVKTGIGSHVSDDEKYAAVPGTCGHTAGSGGSCDR